jgi:two-component system nitrate/nitrite response regulator NarL
MLQVCVIEPTPRLAAILQAQGNVRVIGMASSPSAVFYRQPADMILLSAALPQAEVLRFIQQRHSVNQTIVLADVDESGQHILPFLEAGASGYVPRNATPSQIVSTLYAIHAGKPPLAPQIGTALVERMHELLARQQQRSSETLLQNLPNLNALTAREHEILLLIRDGASNQEIAQQLMIELGTVKNHVHNILKKLNVSRRDQAASFVDLMEQRV